jgi:triosephosphate isomerase
MKKLMAANWKMFKTRAEAEATAKELVSLVAGKLGDDKEVCVFPPFTALDAVSGCFEHGSNMFLGAQNFYPAEYGAYTGEIAPDMLKDLCCSYALAGHSERRHVIGEDDAFIGKKVAFGIEKGLKMILCIGEKIEERKAGQVEAVLHAQLEKGLAEAGSAATADNLVIAYEPVWAIGTGEVAGPEDIVAAHSFIRQELEKMYPAEAAEIRIQYGGSVKPDNAESIMGLDNVDGVLVGGASLAAESFSRIVIAG